MTIYMIQRCESASRSDIYSYSLFHIFNIIEEDWHYEQAARSKPGTIGQLEVLVEVHQMKSSEHHIVLHFEC